MAIPGARNAPRLCPAEPLNESSMAPSGNPPGPNRRTISPLSVAPVARSTLRIGISSRTDCPASSAGAASRSNSALSGETAADLAKARLALRKVLRHAQTLRRFERTFARSIPGAFGRPGGSRRIALKSRWLAFRRRPEPETPAGPRAHHFIHRPESQLRHLLAELLRDETQEGSTYSGFPANRARSAGSCVPTPTEQVFMWHLRSITQPSNTTRGVPNPNSSAPSSAAMARSRPVRRSPSTCTRTRSRRRFADQRLVGLGESPSSHGSPACLMAVSGDAPVPAVVPGDQDHVRLRLRHARRDRPDADLADQLDRDTRPRIHALQVVDQLRDVLDRINVVMRRRRDHVTPGVVCRTRAISALP